MEGRRPSLVIAAVVTGALLLASCGPSGTDRPSAKPTETHHHAAKTHDSAPLRAGETFLDLAMPEPYTPKVPITGTDDYRCFLLDPKLDESAFVTGIDIAPDQAEIVHHVILFRVGPDDLAEAKAQDAAVDGPGWTCFGGAGMGGLDTAPWLGAWAPGGGERILAPDIGIPLEAGSRIVMQVHYNLLKGSKPDASSARLRLASGTADLDPLETMLLPGPVELPCREGKTGPLCDRGAAVLDVTKRFGEQAGRTVAGLQVLCGGDFTSPKASPVQTCDRTINEPGTIRAVAGHMHLLGRSISMTLNPGAKAERVLLDVPVWDFDKQGAKPLKEPAKLEPGDTLRVTCRHDQKLRDSDPELAEAPERYVVWGEGTTDEMCLGIAMVTKP